MAIISRSTGQGTYYVDSETGQTLTTEVVEARKEQHKKDQAIFHHYLFAGCIILVVLAVALVVTLIKKRKQSQTTGLLGSIVKIKKLENELRILELEKQIRDLK